MTFALFSHSSLLEGAPLHLLTLASAWQRSGKHVVMIVAEEGPFTVACSTAGIPVRVVPNLYSENVDTTALQHVLREFPPHVCHVNTILGYKLVERLHALGKPMKILWGIHESNRAHYEKHLQDLRPHHFRLPHAVLFISEATRRVYADLNPGSFTTVLGGIHTEPITHYLEQQSVAQAKRALGIPEEAILLTNIGIISPNKAQDSFLRSFLELRTRNPQLPLHALCVGHVTDFHKPYANNLQLFIREHGLEPYVHFREPQENPYTFYRASSVFVLSSFVEAFPRVTLEAMAFGLPIVASRTYGVTEQLEHKKTGMLVIPAHAHGITEAVQFYIDAPAEAEQMGRRAQEHVTRTFGAQQLLRRYQEVVESLPESAAHTEIQDVSVIIPCHNYGQYLSEAIESVLHQTHAAKEIVVVDDASTDTTAAIANGYAHKGVQYIRGEWHSAGEARNAGMQATTAPFLVFLDADDYLDPHYLQCGLDALQSNAEAAVAFADHEMFGERNEYRKLPEDFHWRFFDNVNMISSLSMVRRKALLQVGGWTHGVQQHADWVTWRRILQLGWKAVKSQGVFFYRIHGQNMWQGTASESFSYPQWAGFYEEPATLFLTLTGKSDTWHMTARFLEEQTFPKDLMHIVVADTSGNPIFASMVRTWLAHSAYKHVTYMAKESANTGALFNIFGRMCITTLAFFVGDSCIPPVQVFRNCISQFALDVVCVSARIPADEYADTSVCFSCAVVRGEHLRHTVFTGETQKECEQDFYNAWVRKHAQKALVDGSCVCISTNSLP